MGNADRFRQRLLRLYYPRLENRSNTEGHECGRCPLLLVKVSCFRERSLEELAGLLKAIPSQKE
jgi:hypothetical protein